MFSYILLYKFKSVPKCLIVETVCSFNIFFQNEDEGVVLQSIRSVHKLFSHYMEVGELTLASSSKGKVTITTVMQSQCSGQ